MPLNIRTNGSSTQNIITSDWFNDIRNLLTGVMADQEVKIQNILTLKAIGAAPTAAPAGSLGAGTTLGIGQYVYAYTYANLDGESTRGPTFSITTTSGNQHVNLTGVTVGPTGTTKRNIYRTAVGGGTVYKYAGTIGDNTTTTYSDSLADGSLAGVAPTSSTFGGTLILQDATGAPTFLIASDGTISGGITVTSSGLQFSAVGAQKIRQSGGNVLLDASGGTTLTIASPSGKISFQPSGTEKGFVDSTGFNSAAGLTISAGGSDITGTATFHSGLTVTGGTLTTSAISASGIITSSAGFNLTGGTNSLIVGGLSRISSFSGTATTTSTNFSHGLGVVPDVIMLTLTIVSSTAHMVTYDPSTLTSSQVKIQSDGTNSFAGLAVKF